MPFTPYHFGPGALIKTIIPRYFSLLVFILTQVLIDCETLYFMVRDEYPIHRTLHTYLGSSIAAVAAILLTALAIRVVKIPISFKQMVGGAFVGAYSHVFLDSLMHRDSRPFLPFSEANPALRIVSVQVLHWACIIAAIFAIVSWMLPPHTPKPKKQV